MKSERTLNFMMKISKTLSVGISFVLSLIFALALLVIGAVAWNYTAVLFPGSGLQPLPAVVMATYPEIIVALVADAMLIKLLHNVSRESVFIPENVACIRTISWMCFAEALLFTGEGVASLMSEQTAAGQNLLSFCRLSDNCLCLCLHGAYRPRREEHNRTGNRHKSRK